MKTYPPFHAFNLLLIAFLVPAVWPAETLAGGAAQVFATPDEAMTALGQAVTTTNRARLAEIFGPAAEDLVNPDEVQGAKELSDFAEAFNATHRLHRQSDARILLEVGPDAWPFPIPLVKGTNGWQFDTAAGVQELLNRRVGRNELDVLDVLREYVDAQREYASRDRDGSGVRKYARKIASSPGKMDGLYWPTDLNGEISPLGPLVADAQREGYARKASATGPQPFHGYFFKILTRQGKHAPGGKYNYIINGNMIGGFALVAWPAEYGESGVMTFVVNQQGRVYQRDLGPKTGKIVEKLDTYDPGPGWQLSDD